MDFSKIAKVKGIWDRFTTTHPKFPAFMGAIQNRGIPVGTEVVVSFTYPDGKTIKGGIIVQQSDLDLIQELKELK